MTDQTRRSRSHIIHTDHSSPQRYKVKITLPEPPFALDPASDDTAPTGRTIRRQMRRRSFGPADVIDTIRKLTLEARQ